ncbi:bZIP transcription factor, partial [Colletotrichum lupini]
FLNTSLPAFFNTFSNTFLPVQLDILFKSSSSSNSNSNSPNQPLPLDISVYTTTSGAKLSHRSSPNNKAQDLEVATPYTNKILRRQQNTITTRKYKQKKVNRIDELELLLKEITRERDDLRIRLVH